MRAQFGRPKPRTLFIVGGILSFACIIRYMVYRQAKSALEMADIMNREKASVALESELRRRQPSLDWERITKLVAEEEKRIEAEESAALK